MGFKSFAERVRVDFVPGVTAVVGPNGSGKSNITDAIRWVLGEQSAKSLRGSKMEDIIFQGSDTRKPLNVAEVTLVLDNSDKRLPVDYEEVSVTRRVYRSGESEFLMNKQACRLKDITELFMDSGLGREAFSIISQGKVEEILSSKSEERRVIFEEAAGVLKYKNRKKQAEYKLAETQENLNRVEDIVYEISGQLEPLEEQASIAKEYLEHKKRLTEHEVGVLVKEIETLHEQFEATKKDLANTTGFQDEKKQVVNEKTTMLAEKKDTVQQIDDKIQSLQEVLLEVTQAVESLEGNKKIYKERLQHFHENKQKLETEIQKYTEKIIETEKLLAQDREKLKEYKDQKNENSQELAVTNEQLTLGKTDLEDKIESLKSDYIELLNQQAAKRNEKNSIKQQLDRMEGKRSLQSDKWNDLLEEREELSKEVLQLEPICQDKQQKIEHYRTNIEKYNHDLKVENNLLADMQQKLYKGYQMLENLKSKKELLEDLKEDFQGFYAGVKEVLKARENKLFHGVHGAIPELIEFEEYLIDAMETALGAQAQHIVVDDEKVARKVIEWLKKSNAGRATFLPISSMQPKSIPMNLLQAIKEEQGFIGIASELIDYDKQYENILRALLGNVIIAKTLKDANDFARKTNRRYRIVTLEGDVVNPGGSMSGGAKKKTNQSLFTRDRELKNIVKKFSSYQFRVQDFESKLKEQKEKVQGLEQKLEQTKQELEGIEEDYQKHVAKLQESKLSLDHLNQRLSIYDQDKLQQEEDQKELTKRANEIDQNLEKLKKELSEIDEEINKLQEQRESYAEKEDSLKEKLQKLRVREAELKTQITNQQEKVTLNQLEVSELTEECNERKQQLNQLYELRNNQQTEEEMDEQIVLKKQMKEDKQQEIAQMREERATINQDIQSLELEVNKLREEEHKLATEIQAHEMNITRLDADLDHRLHFLENEYSITFEKARATYSKPDNLEEAKQQVKLIKRSIEELGTINLGAIDEYDRIKERHEFLTQQQDDLIEAKRTLYEVIAEMDEEMTRRFEETFSQIKEEFQIVFKKLFGGGEAELKLTDPTELLSTGVDIIAQPPGKKLQHLGLLSGGERALTAIALLFAILRVRPVPFCILDEVEAALDEANVTRFAQYLKYFSEDTQFIVITHRKGTMEEADVLYGVTMQESGVSRLVSVKLEEAPELLEA